MGTVQKYYKNTPEKYLVKTEKHIDQILAGLNKHFSNEWGQFNRSHVESTKDDRLIIQDDEGNVVFHMRVFDKDHNGFKCDGIGGVFRDENVDGSCVKELFKYLVDEPREDVNFGFGFCKKSLAEHYVKNVAGGGYFEYNDEYVIYYICVNVQMTEEMKEELKKFDLF